jgi:hypothetical protein
MSLMFLAKNSNIMFPLLTSSITGTISNIKVSNDGRLVIITRRDTPQVITMYKGPGDTTWSTSTYTESQATGSGDYGLSGIGLADSNAMFVVSSLEGSELRLHVYSYNTTTHSLTKRQYITKSNIASCYSLDMAIDANYIVVGSGKYTGNPYITYGLTDWVDSTGTSFVENTGTNCLFNVSVNNTGGSLGALGYAYGISTGSVKEYRRTGVSTWVTSTTTSLPSQPSRIDTSDSGVSAIYSPYTPTGSYEGYLEVRSGGAPVFTIQGSSSVFGSASFQEYESSSVISSTSNTLILSSHTDILYLRKIGETYTYLGNINSLPSNSSHNISVSGGGEIVAYSPRNTGNFTILSV